MCCGARHILRASPSQGILASMTPKHIVSTVVVLLLAAAAARFTLRTPAATSSDTPVASSTPVVAATTTGNNAPGVSPDEIINLPTPPDFRAPVAYAPSTSSDVKAIIDAKMKLLQDKLAVNSFDLAAWTDLGTLHKMGGDYRGAETAWVFVTKASPKHPTAYANLADLYMNFLKDYPKADTMYKKVIALAPDAQDAYISESLLYESFYKAGGSPEAVLKQGITANKDSIELELALARYYSRTGRATDAKAAYQTAINIAQASGSASLVSQIRAEAGL